ncbi:MAG: DUF2299 family protein [Dehalococcoidia bacterium]|nr:DUF2299 family protein [Dehalococcoidia bacterium]
MVGEIFSEDAKTKVRAWLMEDGWSLRQESGAQVAWVFVAEDRLHRKLVVGQNTGREDMLVIQGAVALDEEMTNRVEQLSEKQRNDFLWDLRFELVRTDLEFSGVQIPLKRVEVSERIFFDALTKDTFLQRASQVRKGVIIVQWMLARRFAQQPPKKELGFQR